MDEILNSQKELTDALQKLFISARESVPGSSNAQAFHKHFGIDYRLSNSGFLSKTFYSLADKTTTEIYLNNEILVHYSNRKSSPLIESIIFPLMNLQSEITGIYGIKVNDYEKRTFIGKGTFHYLNPESGKLIITTSIIEAVSLLQLDFIRKDFSVLLILKEEDLVLISDIEGIKQVIFFFDNTFLKEDYQTALQKIIPKVQICISDLEIGESANSLLQKSQKERIKSLLQFNIEESNHEPVNTKKKSLDLIKVNGELDTSNPRELVYKTDNGIYHVYNLSEGDFSMNGGISIWNADELNKSYRISKLDFFSNEQIEKESRKVSAWTGIEENIVMSELNQLYYELNKFRKANSKKLFSKISVPVLNDARRKQCIEFLSDPGLKDKLNNKIGMSGIVGEINLRLFLFLIAVSHKFRGLHAKILGTQSMGKSRLMKGILALMPKESVLTFNRITSASLFNLESSDLDGKVIGIEDSRGIEGQANFALQDLQSGGSLLTISSFKSDNGDYAAKIHSLQANVAIIKCSTKGSVTLDESSRENEAVTDESDAQSEAIIEYQNKVEAGIIRKDEEELERAFIQDCVRVLNKYEVVNPYAGVINMPKQIKTRRRLNQMFLDLTRQITLLFQYQRDKDAEGRKITELQDVELAIELMFDSIVLKADTLDNPILRSFYEDVKAFCLKTGKDDFTTKKLLGNVKPGRTVIYELLSELLKAGFLEKSGTENKGFTYKLIDKDDNKEFRNLIKTELENQIKNLKENEEKRTTADTRRIPETLQSINKRRKTGK